MAAPERRSFRRRQISKSITLTVTEPVTLHGEALNAGEKGILVEARGRLGVQLTVNGHELRGWLARAYRVELNTFAYAIELEDAVDVDDLN